MKAKAKNSSKTVPAPLVKEKIVKAKTAKKTIAPITLAKEKTVKTKAEKVVTTPAPLTKTKAVKTINLKSLTGDELFLHTLKEMGEPSLVRDMVKVIRKTKQIAISKKRLLARLYASASHLNRDGMVKRIPVNGSMYSYSLLRWKAKKEKEKKVSSVNWTTNKHKKKASIAA